MHDLSRSEDERAGDCPPAVSGGENCALCGQGHGHDPGRTGDGNDNDLADVLARFPVIYLITVGADKRAHVVVADVEVHQQVLWIGHTGPTTRRNIATSAAVTVLCPPVNDEGQCLILDGTAQWRDGALVVVPQKAILHRNYSPQPTERGCNDCHRLPLNSTGGQAFST